MAWAQPLMAPFPNIILSICDRSVVNGIDDLIENMDMQAFQFSTSKFVAISVALWLSYWTRNDKTQVQDYPENWKSPVTWGQ